MNNTDKTRFQKIYTALLVGLAPTDEKLVGVKTYFEVLKALPVEYVEQAARRILSRPGQKWMPSTGEWVELASQLKREAEIANSHHLLNAADSPDDGPTYYCKQCQDTSWRPNKDHLDKASGLMISSVSRCPCQMTNPVLAAKRVRALDRVQGRTQ